MAREAVDREAKGVMLAASTVIAKTKDGRWSVPASAPARTYAVDLETGTCTCPDHANRRVKCKHIFAAEYVAAREEAAPSTPLGKEYLARLVYLWTLYAGWSVSDHTQRHVLMELRALSAWKDAVRDADRLTMARALAGAL